ncbi:MAG: TetR/AcrR family transcriptional regulator [Sphaerochaetaceae bacterium]|nr:TetR/AcrR family transcriptional regulator [Sphaerochaetaceae bacterium]
MDLRIIKTKKAIKEAFLELRAKESLEKIKIKDLCQLALINKTTFYKHYKDIFDLSDQLENETLKSVIEAFADKDKILSDPRAFMEGIPLAFKSQDHELSILFDGRSETLTNKFEKILRDAYSTEDATVSDDVRNTFLIGGCVHTFQVLSKEKNYQLKEILDCLVTVLSSFKAL